MLKVDRISIGNFIYHIINHSTARASISNQF